MEDSMNYTVADEAVIDLYAPIERAVLAKTWSRGSAACGSEHVRRLETGARAMERTEERNRSKKE